MENFQVMVILFTIVVLGYVLCKLGYMGDKFDQKLSTIVIDNASLMTEMTFITTVGSIITIPLLALIIHC